MLLWGITCGKSNIAYRRYKYKFTSGSKKAFWKTLYKNRQTGKKYAKILAEVQDNRYRADYDVIYSATQEDAEESLEEANDFFTAIRKYLKKEINL